MACDFSVAQDLALFGQAGPKHGSVADGGSTDFLPLYVGIERAMESCTLCEPWTAHKAYRLRLITKVVPTLKIDGAFVPNPMAVTDRWIDDAGQNQKIAIVQFLRCGWQGVLSTHAHDFAIQDGDGNAFEDAIMSGDIASDD